MIFALLSAVALPSKETAKGVDSLWMNVDKDYDSALFLSFSLNPIMVDGTISFAGGARVVYQLNPSLAFGIGSFNMLSHTIKANFTDTAIGKSPYLVCNYFSFDGEYFINPKDYIVFSAKPTFGLAHTRFYLETTEKSTTDSYYPDYGENWYYFFEPAVQASINVTYWMRVSAGVGYRFAINGNYRYGTNYFDNKSLSGFSSGVYLSIGNF